MPTTNTLGICQQALYDVSSWVYPDEAKRSQDEAESKYLKNLSKDLFESRSPED